MKSLAGDALLSSFGYDVCYANEEEDTFSSDDCEKWIELKPMDLSLLQNTEQGCPATERDPKTCTKDTNDALKLSRYSEDGRLIVNSPYSLRTDDDQFGRRITFLRKSLTSDDTKPFATL